MNKNIVLLHGWGAETKKLEPLKKELEKLGWVVFLPKLAGFEKPAPQNIWGIKEYSHYIYEEVSSVFGNNNFFVFGHSFGGGVAIKMASGNSKNLQGVVLCSTRGISRGKLMKRLVFATLAKAGKFFFKTSEFAQGFRKLLYKAAREHDYEKTSGVMREVFKKVIAEDLKPILTKIKIPTLILWGENDRMTPVGDAYFIKSVIPQSKLVVYKQEGHKLPYERPGHMAHDIEKWYRRL